MFDEFMRQAKRLFSSNTNGGKLVPKVTDRFHSYTMTFIGFCIFIMLSYKQFRSDFECQGTRGISSEQVTNFCYINGTTTVLSLDKSNTNRPVIPHAGLNFATNDQKHYVINHSYLNSPWVMLLALGVFSFIAQRSWAQLFENKVLQAVLQVTSSEESELVKAAEKARLYETLTDNSSGNSEKEPDEQIDDNPKFAAMSKGEQALRRVQQVQALVNINVHDRSLNYYPNQLVYLLLATDTPKYKMANMNLRSRLIVDSVISTVCTAMQFLVPLLVIGPEYKFYGWNCARSALNYLSMWLFGDQRELSAINSFYHKLSESIFPVLTQCLYKQLSDVGGTERIAVVCTVAINGLCAPIFLVLWWAVVINFVLHIYKLFELMITSSSVLTMSSWFGRWCWPNARKQADQIANFRYKQAKFIRQDRILNGLHRQTKPDDGKQISPLELGLQDLNNNNNNNNSTCINMNHHNNMPSTVHLNQKPSSMEERKRMEAEEEDIAYDKPPNPWCKFLRRGLRALSKFFRPSSGNRPNQRRRRLEREPLFDSNIYYLFYLMYLRLGKSKSKTEEVILMTANALEIFLSGIGQGYMKSRDQLIWLQQQQLQQHRQQDRSGGDEVSVSNQSQSFHNQLVQPIVDETTT